VAKKSNNSSRKGSALPRQPRPPKSAQAKIAAVVAAGALLAAIAPFAQTPLDARAYPIVPPRHTATPSASPSASANPNVLPFGTPLAFVLDGTISSASSKAGQIVQAHLQAPIVVGGVTLAPAGTPAQIKIVDASPASNPDIYGYVDIFVRPMTLPDGRVLPLHAQATHLNVNVSAGHESTVDVEDTIGDIYAPTLLYHIFRKGRNFTLAPGAKINLRTQATIVALGNGAVAIQTPMPLAIDQDTPRSSFRAMPMATVNPSYRPPLPTPRDALTPGPLPT
jgi:hypothetical protein